MSSEARKISDTVKADMEKERLCKGRLAQAQDEYHVDGPRRDAPLPLRLGRRDVPSRCSSLWRRQRRRRRLRMFEGVSTIKTAAEDISDLTIESTPTSPPTSYARQVCELLLPRWRGLTRDVHLAVSGDLRQHRNGLHRDRRCMFHAECDVGFYYSGNDIMIGFYRVENTICEDALVTAGYNMTASARARRLEELPVDHPIRRLAGRAGDGPLVPWHVRSGHRRLRDDDDGRERRPRLVPLRQFDRPLHLKLISLHRLQVHDPRERERESSTRGLVICDVAIDIHPSCSSGARDVNEESLLARACSLLQCERAPGLRRNGGRSECVCVNEHGCRPPLRTLKVWCDPGARRGERSLCGEVLGCL